LGEAAYIAYSISKTSQYAGLPAAAFAGFGIERWVTCLLHGVMTAIFVLGIQQRGWRILAGYLLAALIHTLINSSALFLQIGVLPLVDAELILLGEFLLSIGLLVWLWRYFKDPPAAITPPTDPQSAS
jgi:hypothetical protein